MSSIDKELWLQQGRAADALADRMWRLLLESDEPLGVWALAIRICRIRMQLDGFPMDLLERVADEHADTFKVRPWSEDRGRE
jgi:hypothetical protein